MKSSDAEDYVVKRLPNKTIRHAEHSLRPISLRGFLNGVPLLFQPGKAGSLNATYHFNLSGEEQHQATIVNADRKSTVEEGHVGKATKPAWSKPGRLPLEEVVVHNQFD